MPTTLRIIHYDDPPEVLAAATSASNPLAGVAITAKVWVNGGELIPFTSWTEFYRVVRATKVIFNTDLLAPEYNSAQRVAMLAALAARLLANGINPAKVIFITDWEGWGQFGSAKADFEWWYGEMMTWPGYIGNYGNAEGPSIDAMFRWPLEKVPRGRGVSCPSTYNLGVKVADTTKAIATARSRWFWPRKTVVFAIDDAYQNLEGTTQLAYLAASAKADYVVIWNISATHDAAKFPDFTAANRLAQDAITAKNLKKGGK